MHRRTVTEKVAANISQAILSAGTDTSTLASAANMDAAELEARLNSEADLSVGELFRVGGALRVSARSLLKGAA